MSKEAVKVMTIKLSPEGALSVESENTSVIEELGILILAQATVLSKAEPDEESK